MNDFHDGYLWVSSYEAERLNEHKKDPEREQEKRF